MMATPLLGRAANTYVQMILWDLHSLTTNPPPRWTSVCRRAQNGPIYLESFRPHTVRQRAYHGESCAKLPKLRC